MFDNEGAIQKQDYLHLVLCICILKKEAIKLLSVCLDYENWSTTLNITDEKRVRLVNKLDKEIPEILTAYGMKAIENTNTLKEIC